MKNKPIKARRMWANYYPENPARPILHYSRKNAASCVLPNATHAAIPVAVIPLHDVGALVTTAASAHVWSDGTSREAMTAALTAIGVLPRTRKGGRK